MKICKKHKTYKAIRRPRSMCPVCWEIYLDKHPGERKRNEEIIQKIRKALRIKEEA